jgi:hypothetical protein
MIVFDLKCLEEGHVFEAWFGSSGDYESQRQRGLVQCPLCGTERVEKAVMAPRLGAKGNQSSLRGPDEEGALPEAEALKAMLAAAAAAQKKLLMQSNYVGDRFADEARAIHLGEAEARAIHGRATRAEAKNLVEEGIEVAPLPFPVVEPGKEN